MPTELPTDQPLVSAFAGAQANWAFVPSKSPWRVVFKRWWVRLSRKPGPAWKTLVPVKPSRRWMMYFIYLADGKLTAGHRFTLQRLASEDADLLVICACPENHAVLEELKTLCDALYWKAEQGWDFSAYALGLTELARLSPGADVLAMNDSLFGPFKPLVPFMDAAPWRLTGFTGNNGGEEIHLQSYAFVIKRIGQDVMTALAPVMSTDWCYNTATSVIMLQETQLARVASAHFSVGAFWYGDDPKKTDLCLFYPKELIAAGFPFMKRSLLGKFATVFQDLGEMRELLGSMGHPVD